MRIHIQKTILLLVIICSSKAFLLAQPKRDVQATIDSINNLFSNVEESNLHKGMELAQTALTLSEEAEYAKGIADAKSNLGTVYVRQGNFKQGIDHYLSALKLYDQQGGLLNTKSYAGVYMRLAGAFCLEEDFDRALTYAQRAILIADKNNFHEITGIANRIKGESYRGLGKLDSSSHFFELALASFTKTNNLAHIGSIYTDIGINYYYANDYRQALHYTQKAYGFIQQANNKSEYAVLLHNMGEFSYLLKSYKQALFYLDSAQYYGEYFKASGNLMDTYKVKAQVYKALGNTDSVGYYFEKTLQLKDSLYNETYKKELATLQTQSDIYKKETENKLLAKDKRIAELYRNLAVAGIVGLAILLAFLLVNQRLRIQRRVKDKLEEEVALRTQEIFKQKETIFHTNLRLKLALNGTQLDSNFVYHSLTSIQQVLLEQQPRAAQTLLNELAQLMQYVLQKSPLERVSLAEEIQMIERYIQLEQLRMNHRFNYDIVINADAKATLPALLLQPYIENAIQYGLAPASGADLQLKLQVTAADDVFTITITDNGIDRRREKHTKQSPLGCGIGQERLDLLTHLTHKNHLVTIEHPSAPDGKSAGTQIVLQVPLETPAISIVSEELQEVLPEAD